MKKAIFTLMCLFALMAAGTGIKAQEVTITLGPGWTWISIPSTETMDFATALGSFVPQTGDKIKSQWGNATYSAYGGWRGNISEFYPGYGYKYYSTRQVPVTLTFNAQQPSSQVVVSTSEPMLITAISAMGGGEVTTTDGTYILVKGLCWATHENPMTNDFYQEMESGEGSFTVSMSELNISTTYYVRAYAVTPNGTVYGDQKSFTTRDGIPEVSTDSVTNILGNGATCNSTVTDNGGLNVIARGVCWNTSPNPTVNDSHTTDGNGTGSFSSSITGLNGGTTYYVRAYASTNQGTAYGEDVSFTTPLSIVLDSITDIFGDIATCHSIINVHYPYLRGVCWSTSHNPTENDYHFIEYTEDYYNYYYYDYVDFYGDYTIQIGGLSPSTTYYVRGFITYTNSNEMSFTTTYSNEISFTTPASLWPNGVLPGTFSVSASQQVHFSQGNLQYKASTNTWRFGINQWAYVGGYHISEAHSGDALYEVSSYYGNVFSENGLKCDNTAVSSEYSGWIDLFGWGTSGFNHGAYCYQPWSISENSSDYKAYGQTTYNLYDQTGQADWGSNAISNGGNQPNQWHTLTMEEWKYIFNTRPTVSGIRYAKAVVFGVSGVILLPDDWDASCYLLNATNTSDASFDSNIITASQWSILEQNGAVFLPKAGLRHRYTYPVSDFDGSYENDEYGFDLGMFYWSSSCKNSTNAWHLSASDSRINPQNNSRRYNGMAVRLVCSSLSECPAVTTAEVDNITHCQATCGGTMTDDGGCGATIYGVCWSTTPNPTVADAHTVDGNGMGSFSSTMTGLMPSTTYYVRAYASNLFFTEYGSEVSFTTLAPPVFCTISLFANQTEGGIVNGGGTYAYGQSCSIHAMPNTGFYFVNWTENGSVVSTSANYTFTVTENRNLMANFTAYPTGAVNGLFSVSETQQVLFSQGNLQYQPSTNTWKFADNQYDYVGSANSNISSSYSGWVDLFGWGTSGYNHGANCYRPWSTSEDDSDYYAYGSYFYNLYDRTGQADWGYNPISNGGNTSNQWRTLTKSEWRYIFNTRTTVSGIRYAKAQVNNVNGVILLPDDWSNSYYTLSNTNSTGASFSSNTISATQWSTLEQYGAVFLPAAGRRYRTSVYDVGSYGYYWSASYYDSYYAYYVYFYDSNLYPLYNYGNRRSGFSVRLARVAE